jgi:release factor glutamine methyltransferase
MLHKTLYNYYQEIAVKLNGISNSNYLESQILICHALNIKSTEIFCYPEKELSSYEVNKINKLVMTRLKGIPISYITKKKDFYNNTFYVNKHTLIPRPDTEIIVDILLKIINEGAALPNILEIGFGTGCIGISIIKNTEYLINYHAIEISKAAINIAKKNINNLLKPANSKIIKLFNSDFYNYKTRNIYNIIISNPPYIPTSVINNLSIDVRFEPYIALDGGIDGLDMYLEICKFANNHLSSKGIIVLEIYSDNLYKILNIFYNNFINLKNIKIIYDLNLLARVLIIYSN